jgi:hypothetical protein
MLHCKQKTPSYAYNHFPAIATQMLSKPKCNRNYSSPCISVPLVPSFIHDIRLSLSSLQELHVLLRVSLLNVALSNLLHHEVGVDVNLFAELAISDAPLAADGEDTDWGLSVDKRVDTLGDVGESQLVGSLGYVSILFGAERR